MLRNSINTVCRSAAMFVHVCLFVGMIGASALNQEFHYQNPETVRREIGDCKVCYGIDCLEMDHIRCEHYVGTDNLLHESVEEKVNNPEMRAEVDDMMHSLIEKAAEMSLECIPLVSSYTDCHKENICTGCRSCECDEAGRWNCSIVQKCRADPTFDINHRVLLTVIENLMGNDQSSRLKRSVKDKADVNTTKIGYEEIAEWLFDVHPLADQLKWKPTKEIQHKVTDTIVLTKAPITMEESVPDITTIAPPRPNTMIDHDYLAFDEVLNSIAVESKNDNKIKPLADVKNDTIFEYMSFDEYNETAQDLKIKNEFLETTNTLGIDSDITVSNIKGVTEAVIDLLESSKINSITDENNITDYMDENDKNNFINPVIENDNYLELNAVNIMKRDIANTNSSKLQNLNTNENYNNTSGTIELRNDVLLPLSNLINVKQKELDDLLRISENLIKFMKTNQTEDIDTNSNERDNETDTNTSFSIYKLEILPEFDQAYDLRRTNTDILQKMLYKVKRDVYEVTRDIITIQNLTNLTQLPEDLKILIRAMKSYVRSQKNYLIEEYLHKPNENGHFRRHWGNDNARYPNTIIDGLIAILKAVDKNKPESNALAPLSDASNKILKRVIKQNYMNEFTESGLRVFDTNYNLTNDLLSVGIKWQEITKYVTKSAVFDRLYAMKLLHFVLSTDIEKMNDALALLNFAHSRRMSPIDGPIGNIIIEKINNGLRTINDKIKLIIKLHNQENQSKKNTKTLELHKKFKKESFFKELRNVLKNSKKDIVGLIKRKLKKHHLVKELARKKLDDITRRRFTEFEDTMKKWQNKLDLAPRDKRALRKIKYNKRIKNILPRYLRGKVNPAIVAKDMKKTNLKQNKINTPNIRTQSPKLTTKAKGN